MADGFEASEPLQLDRAELSERGGELVLRLLPVLDTASVAGTIVDQHGAPVESALVTIAPESTAGGVSQARDSRSDSSGAFRVSDVPPGELMMVVAAAGQAPWHRRLRLEPRESATVDVELGRAISLVGNVRDVDGRPVVGASLTVSQLGVPVRKSATDESGDYAFSGMLSGPLTLSVQHEHSGSTTRNLTIESGRDTRCDVELDAGQSIRGLLEDSDGAPLPGWEIRLLGLGPRSRWNASVQTDANGRFIFTNLDEGEFELEVAESGNALPVLRRPSVRSSDGEIRFVVRPQDRPSAEIRGVIRHDVSEGGASGAPGTVQAVWMRRTASIKTRIDVETGAFVLGSLAAGEYRVAFWSDPGILLELGFIKVAHGETRDLGEIRVPEPSQVTIAFEPHEVASKARLRVRVAPIHVGPEWSGTWFSGREAKLSLYPGEYQVSWVSSTDRTPVLGGAKSFEVREGASARVDITVEPARTRWLEIRFSDADPPAVVRTEIVDRAGAIVWSSPVGRRADGVHFAAPPLANGEYEVRMWTDRDDRASDTLVVRESDDAKHTYVVHGD